MNSSRSRNQARTIIPVSFRAARRETPDVPYVPSPEDLALHGARVLGFATASRIAGRYGLDPGAVQELLAGPRGERMVRVTQQPGLVAARIAEVLWRRGYTGDQGCSLGCPGLGRDPTMIGPLSRSILRRFWLKILRANETAPVAPTHQPHQYQ
jgi:hypothetical protein